HVYSSRYEGKLSLRRAHALNVINFDDTVVVGHIVAIRFHSDDDLFFRRAELENGLDLSGARINGDLSFSGTHIGALHSGRTGHLIDVGLKAQRLRVDGDLLLSDGVLDGNTELFLAHISGSTEICGTKFYILDLGGTSIA